MEYILGLLIPWLVDFVNRKVAKGYLRLVTAFVFSLFLAILFNLDKVKSGSIEEILQIAGLLFAEAHTLYKVYWQKSDLRMITHPTLRTEVRKERLLMK